MGLGMGLVKGTLMAIILLILTFTALSETATEVDDAAGNITGKSDVYPLTSFFKQKGIILLALMAGITLTIISAVMPKGK